MSRAAAAVLAGVALWAGCGGDDEPAMSVEEYRAEAGAICRAATRAGARVGAPDAGNEGYARFLERLVQVNAKPRAELAALEPPEELRKAHDDLLAANDDGIEVTRRIIARLERGESRKRIFRPEDAGGEILENARRRDDAARRLGVPDCASPRR